MLSFSFLASVAQPPVPVKPNVLYLMADDMRPQLGCYGQVASSPNIDKLAAGGLLFESAYTQFSYCAPSRNSFMTGVQRRRSFSRSRFIFALVPSSRSSARAHSLP